MLSAATLIVLGTEQVFWICAVGGTTFFIIRMLLMLLVGMGDADVDMDAGDVDSAGAADGADGADAEGSSAAFKLLSITALTGFFMMFGWVGLACLKEFELGTAPSVGIGGMAGLAMMWATGFLFQQAGRLTSRGSDFSLQRTVGSTASVYTRIAGDGRGKVQLSVGDMTREIDAISEHGVDLESFTSVRVVRVVDGQTISVEKSD